MVSLENLQTLWKVSGHPRYFLNTMKCLGTLWTLGKVSKNPESFWTILTILDYLESFWPLGKVYGHSKNIPKTESFLILRSPETLENFGTLWKTFQTLLKDSCWFEKVSRPSLKFADALKKFWTLLKVSRHFCWSNWRAWSTWGSWTWWSSKQSNTWRFFSYKECTWSTKCNETRINLTCFMIINKGGLYLSVCHIKVCYLESFCTFCLSAARSCHM